MHRRFDIPSPVLCQPALRRVPGLKPALALLCALLTSPAQSACNRPAGDAPQGLNLQWAAGAQFSRTAANWESPVLCQWHAPHGMRLSLNAELGLAHWSADKPWQPTGAWQLSAIPMWRLQLNPDTPWFIEGGVGATLFNHTHFAGETLSTAYQFGDHLGLGYAWVGGDSLSLRLSHYSNAMIKEPNPGLTMLQLSYTYRL